MNFPARVVLWALLLCFPVGANAEEEGNKPTEVGVGVVCDSAQQVERYLALYIGGSSSQSAVELVNTESHNPMACAMVAVAFVRGGEVNVVSTSSGQMRVMQITIIAARTEIGWQRVPPINQYTAIFEEQIEA